MAKSSCEEVCSVLERRVEETSFTVEEVLTLVGSSHITAWFIIFISGVCFAQFSIQTLVPTVVTFSMWNEWDWLVEKHYEYNLVFALGGMSRLIGSILLLPLIDIFGRRIFLFTCLGVSILSGVSSGLVPRFGYYVALRSLTLFMTSVLPSASIIYSLEMVGTQRRAVPAMLSQAITCTLLVALIFVSQPLNWRYTIYVSNIPALTIFMIFGVLWLETPRFQADVAHDARGAWLTLCKLCPDGAEGLKKRLQVDDPRIHIDNSDEKVIGYLTYLKNSLVGMYKLAISSYYFRTNIALSLIWCLQSFAHWGMTSYMTVFYSYIGLNTTYVTAGSFAVQLPGQFLLLFMMRSPRFGRIGSMKIFSFASGLALLLLALCLITSAKSYSILTSLSLLCYFFGSPLWGTIYAYTAEIYPTSLRGTAMAFYGALSALAIVITTYIGTISLDKDRLWIFPLVWAFLRFLTTLSVFILKKETQNTELPDKLSGSPEQN